MANITAVSRPILLLKIFQLISAYISFGLFFHYYVAVSSFIVTGADSSNEVIVRQTFATTVLTGYPFVILLTMFISLFLSGDSAEVNLMHFLFNFIGFGMYLTTGSVIAHNVNKHGGNDPLKATAAMCLITSFFFLGEVVLHLLHKFKK